ncbi:MAG: polysaccharide biosynthesis protein [Planctomycetota bacterium]|nr:polysaccharide biosynthesis protein [Planctomycetota bacterium]
MEPARVVSRVDPLWRCAVVIGTPETIGAVLAQLRRQPDGPAPAGCVLAEGADAAPGVIDGVPVWGDIDDLPRLHAQHRVSAAIVSLPAGMPAPTLRTRARLRQLSIPERFVPPLADLLTSPGGAPAPLAGQPAGLDLMELVGRTPYGIDRRAVARVIEGKRVLVTGAGGSIGSEICRIAATFRPAELVLMERSENALFEIDRQLARRFPSIVRRALLHDVVDADQTLRHLVQTKPHVIFHAAAHKHVPLMEDHPAHALTNNLFGTKSVADAALATGCERFVMISSDKAVNPTSVMGATKRLAEMYVQGMNRTARDRSAGRTSFTMVRFGNVLGSACSVLPIWGAQLAEGGPITVTDPKMTRYFMTITEAATLVIQAAAIDAHDETTSAPPTIFVLDMGEPIRILDLARRFVMLHGFDARLPGADADAPAGLRLSGRAIDVVFTGARPGEKVHEELAYDAESLVPTPFPGILALAASGRESFDLTAMVAELSGVRTSPERARVVEAIARHVPEMRRPEVRTVTEHQANKVSTPAVVAA